MSHIHYWVAIALIVVGIFVVISHENLVKKILGLNIFQAGAFILYISIGKLSDATAPILAEGITRYSNPLTHVLILTAIVVGVATTAMALALSIRIYRAYGSLAESDIVAADKQEFADVDRQ